MSRLVFGISLGISHCGWAVLRYPTSREPDGEIIAMGTWLFDVPETDKEHTPTNQIRRAHRLTRRVIRRRRQRMADIRRLFHNSALLSCHYQDALKIPGLDPWELRAHGLDRRLSPAELAVALGHIAKRRGFRSSATRKNPKGSSNDQKMLKAMAATREKLDAYRTLGDMFSHDPDFQERKRNREGQFDRSQHRDDLIHEVCQLFKAQRRLGNTAATGDLEAGFKAIAFRQHALPNGEGLVGICPFEPSERRSSRYAPSFEKLRLLTRLTALQIITPDGERPLTPRELRLATADLGKEAKLTIKALRQQIGLPDEHRFSSITAENEAQDISARIGADLPGTKKLRDSLGEALWTRLLAQPETLDRIANILSFLRSTDAIHTELRNVGLPADTISALLADLDTFAHWRGTGHISALASRKLLPHLETGLHYDQACKLVGYDMAASHWSVLDQITDRQGFNRLIAQIGREILHPVTSKAFTEGLKQIWAMRNRWGLPDAVHIEMARDVGYSLKSRNENQRARDRNAAEQERLRAELSRLLSTTDITNETLLRYRLWKEQAGRCPISDLPIRPTEIPANNARHEVDYILPWSRFGDDSYLNKVLCRARFSKDRKGRTPFEWTMATHDQKVWTDFVNRVEHSAALPGIKKRNLVLENTREAEQRSRSRNLHDGRFAARLFADAVALFYPKGEERNKDGECRVVIRPGSLTQALRLAWGIESLKTCDGKRMADSRHHGLDALVVAITDEWEIQRITRSFVASEQAGHVRLLRQSSSPWGTENSFRQQARAALDTVFVARPERRRARGEGHLATIRQVREREEAPVIFERKAVADLPEKRLADIKDPARNQKIVEAIGQWIGAGRPADKWPRSPAGDPIHKIRVRTKGKPAVRVRGGSADRGDIVRIDVFALPGKRGQREFHLVPIYPHQIMNKRDWPTPPILAVVAYRDETEWTLINDNATFLFSLHSRSYVEATKANKETIAGYLAGMDRATGAITLMSHQNTGILVRGIGVKTLLDLKKFNVDRFGTRTEVKSETRTWHGAVCAAPIPTD